MRPVMLQDELRPMMPWLEQVGLGEIVVFGPTVLLEGVDCQEVRLRTGHTFKVRCVKTVDPAIAFVVAMRRLSVVRPDVPSFIVVRVKWWGQFEGIWSFFEQKLLKPLDHDHPVIEVVPSDDIYGFGGRLEQSSIIMPSVCCSSNSIDADADDDSGIDDKEVKTRKPLFGLFKNRRVKRDELLDLATSIDREEETSLVDEKKRWEDAITALVLGYVTRFGQMPPARQIEEAIRGKLMIDTDSVAMSRVVVNGDMKIILPAYNEIELRMTPLVRTVYILFLCHPEGIRLKDIADYRHELTEIYSLVKPGADERLAEVSIAELANPLGDSLRQKLSRSREAVRRYIIDPDRAEAYFIKRGDDGLHRLGLPADMIQLPAALKV